MFPASRGRNGWISVFVSFALFVLSTVTLAYTRKEQLKWQIHKTSAFSFHSHQSCAIAFTTAHCTSHDSKATFGSLRPEFPNGPPFFRFSRLAPKYLKRPKGIFYIVNEVWIDRQHLRDFTRTVSQSRLDSIAKITVLANFGPE